MFFSVFSDGQEQKISKLTITKFVADFTKIFLVSFEISPTILVPPFYFKVPSSITKQFYHPSLAIAIPHTDFAPNVLRTFAHSSMVEPVV